MTPAARAQIQATIAQMEAVIAQLRAQLDEDCDCPEANPTTVRELWDRYLDTIPPVKWKASVVSTTKLILARVGNVPVSRLKIAHWENYRDDPEIRARYSSTTKNIQLKRMKTCFNWAVTTERIAVNPWARAKPERRKPKRQTEISFEGEDAVIARLVEPYEKAFVIVAADSAMRREEIRLIEWTDIDKTGRTVAIPASRTKTHKARTGRLTTRALEALMAIPPVAGSPYVFANPNTKEPWSQVHLWSRWREAADGAGLKPAAGDDSVRYHDLRRTAARRLSRLGAPIAAIQRVLGHESLAVTAEYVDADEKDVAAAHALLEAHLLLAAHAARKGPQRAPGKPAPTAREATG